MTSLKIYTTAFVKDISTKIEYMLEGEVLLEYAQVRGGRNPIAPDFSAS